MMPLTSSAVSPDLLNIARHLPAMAMRHPEQDAVIHSKDGSRLTFRHLNEDADRYAHGLTRLGIRRGARTLVMIRPGQEFVAVAFALFKMGAISVLLDPGMGRTSLLRCIEEVEPHAFIAVSMAHAARLLRPRAFKSVKHWVTVGPRWFWSGPTLSQIRALERQSREFPCADTRTDETAAILFTSGSTGIPKGVVYEHGMFDAQIRSLRESYGIREGEIDLPAFPLFALFSVAMGVTIVIPDMDCSRPARVNPETFARTVLEYGVNQSFGSPAIWDRVGRYCAGRQHVLPSLTRVLMAGAPAPLHVIERLRHILPESGDVHTPYGATEALPVSSISGRDILGETAERTRAGDGTCVGKMCPGITLRIIRVSEEPIPAWNDSLALPAHEIGEIVVKGPVVTRTYYRNDRATSLAKIKDGNAWWHRMGDVGYLDDHGRLWFCGRKADRVDTAVETLYTEPCEAIFNQHPAVSRSALVGVGREKTRRPVMIIEPRRGHFPRSPETAVRFSHELRELAKGHSVTSSITAFLFHPNFPVDVRHNVKISRDMLALWAEERMR